MKTLIFTLIFISCLCAGRASELTVDLKLEVANGHDAKVSATWVNHSVEDVALDPNLVSLTVGLVIIDTEGRRMIAKWPLSPPEAITKETLVIIKAGESMTESLPVLNITTEDIAEKSVVMYYEYRPITAIHEKERYHIMDAHILSNVICHKRGNAISEPHKPTKAR